MSGCEELNMFTISGGDNEGVTPVPIPNTEVKPFSADGTWLETARESRSLPDSNIALLHDAAGCFFCSAGMQIGLYDVLEKTHRKG